MGNYSWNAKEYLAHSSQQEKWAQELIAKAKLTGDEHILDLGCGDGKVTAALAAAVPRGSVTGADSSAEMIAFAKENFPPQTHPNLCFLVRDACGLDFEGRFDFVFSNAALHWLLDHVPMLAGVRKSLKPGGRILLQMGGAGNAQAMREIMDQLITLPKWRDHFTDFAWPYGFHGPEEYTRWLGLTGFTPSRVELIPKAMDHQGVEGLKGWLRTTWMPYLDCLPQADREPFMDHAATAYLEHNPLLPGNIARVDMVRLEVEAVAA